MASDMVNKCTVQYNHSNYQHCLPKVATLSVINWTVISHLSCNKPSSSDGGLLVYHSDHQALSTADSVARVY